MWSNNACLGYIIAGLESLEYSEEKIQEVVNQIIVDFDFVSIEEAKEKYEKSQY